MFSTKCQVQNDRTNYEKISCFCQNLDFTLYFTIKTSIFKLRPLFVFSVQLIHSTGGILPVYTIYIQYIQYILYNKSNISNRSNWFKKLRKLTLNDVNRYSKLRKLTVNYVRRYGKLRKLTVNLRKQVR